VPENVLGSSRHGMEAQREGNHGKSASEMEVSMGKT